MAVQDSDGKYIGANGVKYDNASGAYASLKTSAAINAGTTAWSKTLGNNAPGLIKIIIFAIAFFLIVQIVRNLFTLAKIYWLFTVAILLAIFATVLLNIFLRKINQSILLILSILVAGLIGFFGCKAAASIYNKGEYYFQSLYSNDFILEQPDGKAPTFSEKKHGKGNVLKELAIGEMVTVNGISLNLSEYNITTSEGVTGWVVNTAFPKNGQEMPFGQAQFSGNKIEHIVRDRRAEMLAEKYMEKKNNKFFWGMYSMVDNTLRNSIRVNAETSVLYFNGKKYRSLKRSETAELLDMGDTVKLLNIIYAPDCTMMYLSANKTSNDRTFNNYDLSGWFNANDWKKSLVVKDLDSNESWYVYPTDYRITANEKSTETNIVFFFPPFKTRHFSLTHNGISPLPSKSEAGFGGPLGFLSNIIGANISNYYDWNFSEVRVR